MIEIRDIFDKDGVLKKFNSNYSERPSQIEAAELISDALSKNKHVLLEGPCGFGKTLSYLIPILNKIADGGFQEKVVIATSGISLQEQLHLKDIPFTVEVMKELYPSWPSDFKHTLLKGRRNFLCKERASSHDVGDLTEGLDVSENFKDAIRFSRETKTGDLSELDFVLNNKELELLTCVDAGSCSGKSCESYRDCYYQKHKAELVMSNVIVTNYHMLFTDNKLAGSIMPSYDILVFDEAHEAPSILREFEAQKVTIHTFNNIRNKVSEITNKVKDYKTTITTSMERYITHAEQFMNDIDVRHKEAIKWSPLVIYSQSELPDTDNLITSLKSIMTDMDKVSQISKMVLDITDSSDSPDIHNTHTGVVNVASSVIESCNSIIKFIGDIDTVASDDNNVVWIEKTDVICIGVKKVEVGDALRESFLEKENVSCILTSATISVANSFSYIKEQFGMSMMDDGKIEEFIGQSPFNLTDQQLWYLPSDAVEGNKPEFASVSQRQIQEIIVSTYGGVLALFTSISAMRNCREMLDRSLPSCYRILMQGDMPRSKLIEEFRADGDSVLLGTKSFFTGVDIPGDSLRCVIVDKFPFPQPSDPVQQKLKDKDNSFYRFSIPDMVISLKQAVGRGVRAVDDRCVIAVLDGRMATARYKTRIFNSFNYKKTSTRDISAVNEFIVKSPNRDWF
ncbi:MAG: ATP-dependent DNA helicase [Paraclostridium sp.]